MQHLKTLMALCLAALLAVSCGTTKGSKKPIPTQHYIQYSLNPGPSQTQKKSDIDITLQIIKPSDTYNYPGLFAFNVEDVVRELATPDNLKDMQFWLNQRYPKGLNGFSWANPFVTPGGKESLLIGWAKVTNNTEHILRMKDARVYLISEGKEPLSAFAGFDELLSMTDFFERATNEAIAAQNQKGGIIGIKIKALETPQLPRGFFRALLRTHKDAYKLINDLNKEILPGFTYEGLLVFPSAPDILGAAKISFYDITTKTDAAGNPVEKTRFEFPLERQEVSLWYDQAAKQWREGVPPTTIE